MRILDWVTGKEARNREIDARRMVFLRGAEVMMSEAVKDERLDDTAKWGVRHKYEELRAKMLAKMVSGRD